MRTYFWGGERSEVDTPPFRSRPHWIQLGDLEELCELPSGVWGEVPDDKRFGAY